MTAIVFANELVAHPFLKRYHRGRFEGLKEGETVQDNEVIVSVVGSGKLKAALRTERLLRSETIHRLIHPGTCSSLTPSIHAGTILGISQVFEGDRIELAAPTYPRMPLEVPFPDIPQATLVTQDHVPQDESEQSYWQRIADLTDDTTYAVAYVTATYGIPCHVIKVVSDRMYENSHQVDASQMEAVEHLADFLIDAL